MATINWGLQHKRDTAANWTSNNPTLLAGQLGIETDALTTEPKFKIGDGTTAWTGLPYAGSSGLSGLTIDKYTKATSATTIGNALLSDDGTNVILPSGKKITGADITKIMLDFGTTGAEIFAVTTDGGAYAKPYIYLINDSGGQDLVEVFVDAGINGFSIAKSTGSASILATNTVFLNAPNVTFDQETASRIAHLDSNKSLKGLDTATYPSLTELSYVKGLQQTLSDYDELYELALQNYMI